MVEIPVIPEKKYHDNFFLWYSVNRKFFLVEKCSSSPHVQRDNFEIIGRENYSYVLKIKESIFIYKYKPKLNGTLSSAPLYLFT